jgi:hypothetical protein
VYFVDIFLDKSIVDLIELDEISILYPRTVDPPSLTGGFQLISADIFLLTAYTIIGEIGAVGVIDP